MTTEAAAVPSNRLHTSALTTTTGPVAPAAPAAASSSTLGATDFLSLLTTELKNQDPLNPVDSTQSIAQLAQFSALQATTNMSTQFTNFASNFAVSQASGLLGESVTVAAPNPTDNNATITGTVKSIQVANGAPQFTLTDTSGNPVVDSKGNPLEFKPSQITGIAK